jgi:hypothetical protein
MTDPASAISRRLDELIQRQINALQHAADLTDTKLYEFRVSIAEIYQLFDELNQAKPMRSWPTHSHKQRFHHSV